MINMENYLKRISASHYTNGSLQNLEELQSLHMQHIPFENLDVIRKVPIYLNLDTIYDKLVSRNRGGFCYELNGLFHWLLTELGYEASLVSATVRRINGMWAKTETHAAIIVQLDKTYLVDVGFGDSTILPIPLDGLERTDVSGTYKIEKQENDFHDLIQKRNDVERILYRFTTQPKKLIDFHEGCVFNQVSKESSFTHTDIITVATPFGRKTISDSQFIITENGVQEKKDVSSDEKKQILRSTFGIQI